MNDVRSLAGGVVCPGFPGSHIDRDLAGRLERLSPGGVVLFSRNTPSLRETRPLTDRLRGILDRPIIAIDQEGGRVMRITEGAAKVPPMREAGDAATAERYGTAIGNDLREAGCNMDFAPVLDLGLHSKSVIGDRSFGSDPELVAQLGDAFARGLQSAGIAATFKHFPGHGSTGRDSHVELPEVTLAEDEFRARDLVPFARLLPGAQAVMTAHIVVHAFDAHRPATLSPRILKTLLREELGFAGVCFTDCLEMDAIAKSPGSVAGGVQALAAGADCLLFSHRLELAEQCVDAIVQAVESEKLPYDRLAEAHGRVLALRKQLC